MSSLIPDGTMPFLLYLILKKGVAGGKMWRRCGAGELFISFTFKVWVFLSSYPANLTIEGFAEKRPLDPTASN
tara:strand:- start:56 stop:274 length:219 start_codon:yes stop_codon:yes gene_type:complete